MSQMLGGEGDVCETCKVHVDASGFAVVSCRWAEIICNSASRRWVEHRQVGQVTLDDGVRDWPDDEIRDLAATAVGIVHGQDQIEVIR